MSLSQSRGGSVMEDVANCIAGYGLSVALQRVVFPALGLPPSIGQSLKIGLTFRLMSVLRSYAIRLLFERLRVVSPS